MIGTIIARLFVLAMLVMWYIDTKEEAVKRSKLTPEQRRLQKLYARQRKRKWQPLPKHPVARLPRRRKNWIPDQC